MASQASTWFETANGVILNVGAAFAISKKPVGGAKKRVASTRKPTTEEIAKKHFEPDADVEVMETYHEYAVFAMDESGKEFPLTLPGDECDADKILKWMAANFQAVPIVGLCAAQFHDAVIATTSLALLGLLSVGPPDEISAARASSLPPTALFVSFLSIPPDSRPRYEAALQLAMNGASFRRKPVFLSRLTKTLSYVDTVELEWPAEAVQALLGTEVYFRPLDPGVSITRADWLATKLTTAESYYALMGFGKTLGELEAKVGLDRKAAERLRARHGSRVIDSGVAVNPRSLERLGGAAGGVWITYDARAAADVNPFEGIDELVHPKADAHEIFGTLPNGLMFWALADGKGKLVPAAPIDIAVDRRTPKSAETLKDIVREKHSAKVVEVKAPSSCLGCHALGLRTAGDFVSGAIAGGRLDVLGAEKAVVNRIDDFFDAKAQAAAMEADSEIYRLAVLRATGKPPGEAAADLSLVRFNYEELPVSAAQAAAELGMTPEAFGKTMREKDSPERSSTLRALTAGTGVPRELWEKTIYVEAAIVAGLAVAPSKPIAAPRLATEPKEATDATTGKPIVQNPDGSWRFK